MICCKVCARNKEGKIGCGLPHTWYFPYDEDWICMMFWAYTLYQMPIYIYYTYSYSLVLEKGHLIKGIAPRHHTYFSTLWYWNLSCVILYQSHSTSRTSIFAQFSILYASLEYQNWIYFLIYVKISSWVLSSTGSYHSHTPLPCLALILWRLVRISFCSADVNTPPLVFTFLTPRCILHLLVWRAFSACCATIFCKYVAVKSLWKKQREILSNMTKNT